MINEVELIVSTGSSQSGLVSEPLGAGSTGTSKIGVSVEPNASIIGSTIVITDVDDNTYTRTVVDIVFGDIWAELWSIYYDTAIVFMANPKSYTVTTRVDEYLDLYENESISQNWSFTDISDFTTMGSYSREFRVPLSDRNQRVFGAAGDINYLNDGTNDTLFNTKIPAEIRVNTLPIIKGHIRVMKAFKQLDRFTDVQLTFYSETPDLIRNIGEAKLKDLSAMSTLDHICDSTKVLDTTGDILYSLIDRGQRWDETGTENSRPILNQLNGVAPADLTPSVKWRWIFEQVMSDAGFTYDADDLLAVLDNYYMPFITRFSLTDPTKYLFTAQITTNQSITSGGFLTGTTEIIDNNGVYASDIFTAPIDCVYYFDFYTTMFVSTPVNNGRMVQVYITDTTTNIDYLAGSVTNGNTGSQYVQGHTPAFFNLIGGHTYQVKYRVYNFSMIEITTPQTFLYSATTGEGTGWKILQVGDVTTNTPITMSELAPDVKQVDFIRDVIRMHNLVVVPDRSRENHLIVQSMVNYLGSGAEVDWTSRLDISKDITIESTTDMQRSDLLFTYSSGADVASKFFNDIGGRIYGDYKINGYQVSASTPANQFASGNTEIKLATQSTPAQEIAGTNIAIPKFINDKGEFVAPFMRCLYYAGEAEILLIIDNAATLTSVPVLNHYSTVNASISDYDLNFSPETPLHDIVSNPYNNLFNLYWRNYLNSIYSPEARLMTASFALDLTDILTFSFANQYWINGAYWRILEINDYKVGGNESTQVKLLKVVNPIIDCDLIPTGSLANGEVQWTDQAGNPTAGTSLCCNRYNWYWSNGQETCFSVLRQGDNSTTGVTTSTNGGSIGDVQAPRSVIRSTINLNADTSSQFSAYVGSSITIDKGNIGTLAAGRSLKLDGENGGAVLLGKNVLTKSGGLHVGGGWMNNTGTNAEGNQQWGILIHANKDVMGASGDTLEMPIESIANNRINLPDSTSWACVVNANISTTSTHAHYMWSVYLKKDGSGIASATAPVLIGSDSTLIQLVSLVIDTASDTSEHRVLLQFTGAPFPIQIYAMMTTQYLQLRV